jgi:hypothetical protein
MLRKLFTSFDHLLRAGLAAGASLALVGAAASAQCLVPDNLNGPCCAPVVANLPVFPPVTLPGIGICWVNCTPTQTCTQVTLGMPQQIACAQYSIPFEVRDCAGNLLLISKLHADYTRTWEEFPIAGAPPIQVWRFTIKADMNAGPAPVPLGCPVPTCLGAHPSAFYYGYLDYAQTCQPGGGFEAAVALYHGCDKFQHDPLLSDKPGVFHPGTSYAVVAPSTPANPFIPALSPAPAGPVFAEALRNVPPTTAAATCIAEEPIVQGVVQFLAQACACPFAFVPPQVTARHIQALTACNSSINSLNLFPAFPWFEVMSTSLGSWTTAASYPGPERIWADEGIFLHQDTCDTPGALTLFGEIKYGATTLGGYPAVDFAGQALNKFTDLVNNYAVKVGAPIVGPFVGSVYPSRHLAYLNYF